MKQSSTQEAKSASTGGFSDSQKRGILVTSVFLFPVVLTSLVFLLVVWIGDIEFPENIGVKSDFAEITKPADRALVNKQFNISGKLNAVPDDRHVFLIESRDSFIWPKYQLDKDAELWEKKLTLHVPDNQFVSYEVVMIDDTAKKQLDQWFATTRETGKYPGIKPIESAITIAKIRVKK